MNPIVGTAIYIILWWLTFFLTLPLGARSFHEAGEAPPAEGADSGAPRLHRLGLKAGIAAGIAAVLWLVVAWAIKADLFHVLPA
jgi:predicted secreted protein